MAKEYKIKIQNELTVDSKDVTGQNNPADKNGIQKPKSNDNGQSTSEAVAMYTLKKLAQTAISNFGSLTGDYIQSAYLSGAVGIVSDVFMIAKFGWAGVAMVAVDTASQGVSKLTTILNTNRASEQLTIRTGGSR